MRFRNPVQSILRASGPTDADMARLHSSSGSGAAL
jgi:hypothetical protein